MTEGGRVETEVRGMLHDLAKEAGEEIRIPPRTVQRARLRRARTVTVLGVTAALISYGVSAGWRALHVVPQPSTTPAVRPTIAPVALPQSVRLVHLYQLQPELTAADSRFFGIIATKSTSSVWITRIGQDGTLVRRRLNDPLAGYYSQSVAQGQALFIGTSVIQRFTSASDELLRLDASTLTVTAKAKLPGGVYGLVADPRDVWVALADRILRLDPVSLQVRATFAIPGALPPPRGISGVGSIARGPGGLWATFGDAKHTTLYRFDPTSLAVLSQTEVPESGQGIEVVAGPESVWLTGTNFVRSVDPSGRLARAVSLPGSEPVQSAAAQGRGLVALLATDGSETLVQLNGEGVLISSSELGDAGGRLLVDGKNVWLSKGLGLAQWELTNPTP